MLGLYSRQAAATPVYLHSSLTRADLSSLVLNLCLALRGLVKLGPVRGKQKYAGGQMLEILGFYNMCISNTSAGFPHFGGKMFTTGSTQYYFFLLLLFLVELLRLR